MSDRKHSGLIIKHAREIRAANAVSKTFESNQQLMEKEIEKTSIDSAPESSDKKPETT